MIAFFRCLVVAVSFSMSWWQRIGSAISRPTIWPGPAVHGPPVKSCTRAPVLGKLVSRRATARERATWLG